MRALLKRYQRIAIDERNIEDVADRNLTKLGSVVVWKGITAVLYRTMRMFPTLFKCRKSEVLRLLIVHEKAVSLAGLLPKQSTFGFVCRTTAANRNAFG